METSYPVSALAVNTLPALPSRVASFYRWLHRWYTQTEDLHASTRYYADKQGVSERTVYRWLARLKALGYLTSEQTVGVERRITPQAAPPPKRRKMSGVCQGKMSGVLPYKRSHAQNASTGDTVTPEASEVSEKVSALADELSAAGIPAPVAVNLVASHGLKAAQNALNAFQMARNIENPAGWLIRAVERKYQFAPKHPSEVKREAKRVYIQAPPPPAPVDGLTGKAAFDALRSKLGLGGVVAR
jgi:hypothetical protein